MSSMRLFLRCFRVSLLDGNGRFESAALRLLLLLFFIIVEIVNNSFCALLQKIVTIYLKFTHPHTGQ